jgi:23S rRNA (uracil1939-C5)-methyltransferase
LSRLDCPKLERCPGCPLGGKPYAAGVLQKEQEVRDVFASFATLKPAIPPARAAIPTLAYRLRAKLVAQDRALGLYERGSHRVVDVSGCRVLSMRLTAASEALRRALPLPIHGADLRETEGGVLVTLLTDSEPARAELEQAAQALLATGTVSSVAVSVRPEGSVRLLAGEPEVVAGPQVSRHRLSEEAPYAYAAHGGFVQAHGGQARQVQRDIAAGLAERCGGLPACRVLELFAGNGSLALALARAGAEVTAVEAYAPAIALAERAAREQGLRLRAVADDAGRFLRKHAAGFDALVVNPPRRGLESGLRRALRAASPRAVAYLSCNPQTLARDLWHLQQLGLGVVSAEPLDMIPWSDAVEVLCWLEPCAPPAPRVLFEDEHWQALDKPPYERLSGDDHFVVPGQLGTETSGVVFRAKTPNAAASLRQALLDAEREFKLLVRGNLRKQGTVTRRHQSPAACGARYKKQASVGRHSLVSALLKDVDEAAALRDFASIGHPVLGDAHYGDARSNQHLEHRHGLDRAFVHCTAIRLRSHTGEELHVRSELPPDLAQVLASLSSDEPAM